MTNRDVAFMASRLLAVYLLILIIQQLAIFTSFIQTNFSQEHLLPQIIPPITLLSAYSALALILWFSADRVARLIVKAEKRVGSDNTSGQEQWPVRDLQAAVFSLAGLLVVIHAVRPLVNNAAYLFLWNEEMFGSLPHRFSYQVSLAAAVFQLALGVCLFLGAKDVVNFINRGRTLGIENTDEQDIM